MFWGECDYLLGDYSPISPGGHLELKTRLPTQANWPPLQKLREDVYAQSRQRLVDWIGSYKIKIIGLV